MGTDPIKWLRFLDDVLMLWKGSREELDRFHHHLNNQMSGISFTMEASADSATFLDLQIYKGRRFQEEGILDIGRRPTHKHSFTTAPVTPSRLSRQSSGERSSEHLGAISIHHNY